MSPRRFLFQFSGPLPTLAIQEGVEAALMAVAFGQPVTVLLEGDLGDVREADVPGLAELLELADSVCLHGQGFETTVPLTTVSGSEIETLRRDHTVVMQF